MRNIKAHIFIKNTALNICYYIYKNKSSVFIKYCKYIKNKTRFFDFFDFSII